MARSGGVTFSAALVLIGSAFIVLLGLAVVVTLLVAPGARQAAGPAFPIGLVAAVEGVIFFGFGGWGIATGVGLLQLRRWARISVMVYSGLLVFFGGFIALVVAFIPFPAPADPNLPRGFMTTMRFGMAGFYLLLAALGAFWLYFFNRKSVKDQFLGAPAATRALALDLAPASASARPLSITVIAWFLVIGALLAALGYPLSRAMFRERELPFCFLGIFVSGTTGMMIFYSWMLAQATAAVGLFRLKRWGWLSAIALQILGIANTLLIFAVPANFARFNEVLKGLHTVLPSSANQSVAFLFPAWLGMAGSLPLVVAVLWILISQRKAFSPHTPARQ